MHQTYSEVFPVGSRVVIKTTSRREGTDSMWNGHAGEVASWIGNSCASIKMEKPKRGWPNPVVITAHNLFPYPIEKKP
jgi:hypothetical protein